MKDAEERLKSTELLERLFFMLVVFIDYLFFTALK